MNRLIQDYIIAVLVGFSSIFYLKGLGSSFQPAVLFSLILFFLSIFSIFHNFRVDKKFIKLLVFVLFILILLFTQSFYFEFRYGFINEIGRHVFPLFVLALSYYLYKNIVFNKILFIKTLYLILVVFLFLDLLIRFYINGAFFPSYSRYDLKFGGLVFIDSNFSGILAGSLFLLSYKFNLKTYRPYLLFIIFYSFSLTVYISLLFVYFFKLTSRNFIFKVLGVFLFIFLSFFSYFLVMDDGSFKTKINIINSSLLFFETFPFINLLLGIGSGNFKTVFGGGAHNLLGIFVEMGIFYLLFFQFLYYGFIKDKRNFSTILFLLIGGIISLYPVAYLSVVYFLMFVDNPAGREGLYLNFK